MLRDLLLRATKTLENKDRTRASTLFATAIIDKLWEPFGHDVEHGATMCLLDCINSAATADDPGAELAKYRETWGVDVDEFDFLKAVEGKRKGGHTPWWPHAYRAIEGAGLKPQSRAAVEKAWDRWHANIGQWFLLPCPSKEPLEKALGMKRRK
jgi:hypothetical protein